MFKLLVTGGTGFIGKALCENLRTNNYLVHTSSRNNNLRVQKGVLSFNIGEINKKANEYFKKVVKYKPLSSRKESKEIYIYCKGIKKI